jgi:hypothetical protein
MRFFERVAETNASVRETERAAKTIQVKKHQRRQSAASADDTTAEYRQLLERALSTKVEIRHHQGTGSLTVHFYSEEELREIVKKVLGKE